MNIRCKLFGHHWHALDFIEFGWELKFCGKCKIQNYHIDNNNNLVKHPEKWIK